MEEAPDFSGDPIGARAWLARTWRLNPWWCPRHWLRALTDPLVDGEAASVALTEELPRLMPRRLVMVGTVAQKNDWLFRYGLERPVCCRLGEERIAEIWARSTRSPA